MTHYRHQAINFTPSASQFLSVSETLQFSAPDRPFNLSDITAICFNVGRVTPAMINVHAQAFQQMAYQWSLNTNTIPAVSDYQGAAAYMMGMDYYSHVSQFLPINEQLHKAQVVSWFSEGLSRLTPVQLGAQNFMRRTRAMARAIPIRAMIRWPGRMIFRPSWTGKSPRKNMASSTVTTNRPIPCLRLCCYDWHNSVLLTASPASLS
jgi:hypothetical protein